MNTVIHIPHASRTIPPDVREHLLLSDEALEVELLAMTDAHTDELFHQVVPDGREIRFPVSRLVVDPERFVADDVEPMSRAGMGVVYTRTSNGAPLRNAPSAPQRADLLARFYEPHHAALTKAAGDALAAAESCLILDCHSFPSRPLPYELDQDPDRPDICIGTDATHTPRELLRSLRTALEAAGFRVAVNKPFGGTIVPAEYFNRESRVTSIMIEVNRRLYMDETTGMKTQSFKPLRALLAKEVRQVVSRAG
jgi:N-formylglutamate deformylase